MLTTARFCEKSGHGCKLFSCEMNKKSTKNRHLAENFGGRVKRWRREQGISQEILAKHLDITRSYLSQVENGDPASAKLQARFRRIAERSESVGEVSRFDASFSRAGVPADAEIVPLRLVPLVSWAQAGHAVDYDELPVSWQKRVHTSVMDPKAFAVSIAGNSMEPRYHEGDVAFLEPSKTVRQHDTVIARLKDEGVVFKIYSRTGDTVRFSSYNPAYPPFEVEASEVAWAYPVHSVLSIVNK